MNPAISILFVDDDVVFQDLVRYSLARDTRFRVECVSSGAEALERMNSPGINVILSDVMMPQMSGPELLEIVREREDLVDLPFIFITAATISLKAEHLMELGALGVIEKPFDPITLAARIGKMLGLNTDA